MARTNKGGATIEICHWCTQGDWNISMVTAREGYWEVLVHDRCLREARETQSAEKASGETDTWLVSVMKRHRDKVFQSRQGQAGR